MSFFNAEADNYNSVLKAFDWVETHAERIHHQSKVWSHLTELMFNINVVETNGSMTDKSECSHLKKKKKLSKIVLKTLWIS